MSAHLSPQEVVDAVDASLELGRRRHLDDCERCRLEVERCGRLLQAAQEAGDVPEPSPLFWEHLQTRVRESTAEQRVPSAGWLRWGWRALAVAGPGLAVVLLVVSAGREGVGPSESPAGVATAGAARGVQTAPAAADPEAWSAMAEIAAELPVEELQVVAPVRIGTTDGWLEALSPDERAELARLLREAMEGGI